MKELLKEDLNSSTVQSIVYQKANDAIDSWKEKPWALLSFLHSLSDFAQNIEKEEEPSSWVLFSSIACLIIEKADFSFFKEIKPHCNENSLFLQPIHWEWMCCLNQRTWSSDLHYPPEWILVSPESFLLSILYSATPLWIERHLLEIFQNLMKKAQQTSFIPSSEHFLFFQDFIHLLRRHPSWKRSGDILLALSLLRPLNKEENALWDLFLTRVKSLPDSLPISRQAFWKNYLKSPQSIDFIGNSPLQKALQLLYHGIKEGTKWNYEKKYT